MNIAAGFAARNAVGASALAALAVSAYVMWPSPQAPEPQKQGCFDIFVEQTGGSTTFGDIIVVGTSEHERVVEDIKLLRDAFSFCPRFEHVVVYARVESGRVIEAEAYGRDDPGKACAVRIASHIAFRVTEPFDVMIPVGVH